MGQVGDMLQGSSMGLASPLVSGIASGGLSAIGTAIGSSSSAHYARKNMRVQDQLQRNFLLDSASLDKYSKQRAGMSPLASNGTSVAGVNASPVDSTPDLPKGVDTALKAKEVQQQQDLNQSVIDNNKATEQKTKMETAGQLIENKIKQNDYISQLRRGLVNKFFMGAHKKEFESRLGSLGYRDLFEGSSLGLADGFQDALRLINPSMPTAFYMAQHDNPNPQMQNYIKNQPWLDYNLRNKQVDNDFELGSLNIKNEITRLGLESEKIRQTWEELGIKKENVQAILKTAEAAGISAEAAKDTIQWAQSQDNPLNKLNTEKSRAEKRINDLQDQLSKLHQWQARYWTLRKRISDLRQYSSYLDDCSKVVQGASTVLNAAR